MTSDPGDWIGAGRSWSHGPPADSLRVYADRRLIQFEVRTDAEFAGGWWWTEFAAPPGQDFAVGTYEAPHSYPFNEGAAGFSHSGNGRGCNGITATFTIHELAYDPDGTLRRFRADFEQRCENSTAALRGTWDFTAAG